MRKLQIKTRFIFLIEQDFVRKLTFISKINKEINELQLMQKAIQYIKRTMDQQLFLVVSQKYTIFNHKYKIIYNIDTLKFF